MIYASSLEGDGYSVSSVRIRIKDQELSQMGTSVLHKGIVSSVFCCDVHMPMLIPPPPLGGGAGRGSPEMILVLINDGSFSGTRCRVAIHSASPATHTI